MIKKKHLVSVSGGETSGMMAKLLIDSKKLIPESFLFNDQTLTKMVNDTEEYVFLFCNTSREDERTLVFLEKMRLKMKIPLVWIEALVFPGRKGTSFSLTDFNKSKRDGEVFENVIKKYGIPNIANPHCSRELKTQPAVKFAQALGWKDYYTVIGFRFDEPKRINLIRADKKKYIYPLYQWLIEKKDVKFFWSKQKFNLGLLEFEGNCKMCFKKSKRKLLTQIKHNYASVLWIQDIENKYKGYIKAERTHKSDLSLFFRDNTSIYELIDESKLPFEEYKEKDHLTSQQNSMFDVDLDEQESCSESCEPF